MVETCLQCSTDGACPFSFTEQSERAQNFGCLPTPYQILSMRIDFGKTWACHSNPTKPCLGALEYLKKHNLPFNVIDTNLVTEDDDWVQFIKSSR